MLLDITRLDVADTLQCSERIRAAARGQQTVESAARALCDSLYDTFGDPDGNRACALVRFYVTAPFAALRDEEQEFARGLLAKDLAPWPELRCLVLLGTRGEIAAWNSRHLSRGHRAIPLPSMAAVESAPMIAQLFKQMGASIADIVAPAPRMLAPQTKRYNVFHVAEARGSSHIPAQADFVERYRVRSVVGFGGMLPWGELFAMILFSRAPINAQSAVRFRTLALDVRASLRGLRKSELFEVDREDAATAATTNVVPGAIELARSLGTDTLRSFRDSRGVDWKVWAITPSVAELEWLRSTTAPARFTADESWLKGWLLFESEDESRRLRPIPPNWISAQDADLDLMCRQARPVRRAQA